MLESDGEKARFVRTALRKLAMENKTNDLGNLAIEFADEAASIALARFYDILEEQKKNWDNTN